MSCLPPRPRLQLSVLLASLLWFGPSAIVALPDGSDLTIEVTTDASAYALGGPVTIDVTKCNPTDQQIVVPHDCLCCHDRLFALDDSGAVVSELSGGCILVIYALDLDPGECSTWDFNWSQSEPLFDSGTQVPPGRYTLRHEWAFQDFTTVTESAPIFLGTTVGIPTLDRIGSAGLALFLGLAGAWILMRRRSFLGTSGPE